MINFTHFRYFRLITIILIRELAKVLYDTQNFGIMSLFFSTIQSSFSDFLIIIDYLQTNCQLL
jgi:hypothetical protein